MYFVKSVFAALVVSLSVSAVAEDPTQELDRVLSEDSSGSLAQHIKDAEAAAALEAQISATQKTVELIKAQTELVKAEQEFAEAANSGDISAAKEELDAANLKLAEYQKLMEAMNSQQTASISVPKPDSTTRNPGVIPPALYVIDTSIGGKAKPKAQLQTDTGSKFLVRIGTSIKGWAVSDIRPGAISIERDGSILDYNSAGLVR